MTTPSASSGRPSRSVSPDNFNQAEAMQVLIDSVQALNRTMEAEAARNAAFQDAQQRYGMSGSGGHGTPAGAGMMYNRFMPQASKQVLQSIAGSGGMATEHMTAGMTQIPPLAATASLQNLRAFGAQQIGQFIAGASLYGEGDQRGRGGPQPGATPPGQTTSTQGGGTTTGVPLQDAAAAAWQQSQGAPPPGGPAAGGASPSGPQGGLQGSGGGGGPGGPGGGALPPPTGGLPQMMFPSGRHAAPLSAGQSIGRAAMQHVGARVALSGGSGSGLMGALRHLPVLGLGLDLVSGAASFYQNQREAGRRYQEVEGGSNLEGQAERMHGAAYDASMMFAMPSGAASEAFNAVTDMGYNRMTANGAAQGQNRQSALNFIYHNYTARGMDVDDSVKILQTASQNSAISLGQVSDALERVSDTAGKAGTNAETARNQFNQLMQVAIGQGAGPGAAGIAGAVATTQAAYGRQFAGTNFSGEVSTGMQYMLSGKYGITPAETQDLMRTSPQQYANMLSGNNLQVIQQLMSPAMMTSMKQMINQQGGGGAMTGDIAQSIAQQFLNEWQVKGNINLDVWAQVISQQTGVGLNPNTVMPWVVQQVAGNNEAAHAMGAGQGRGGSVSASATGGAPSGQYGLAQGTKLTALPGAQGGHLGLYSPAKSWQQVLTSHSGAAAKNYLTQEQKSGKRSPVLEALLQNLNQSDKVSVNTKNGPRVMSFADAMKFYPNEMEAGDVQFYSSSGKALGDTSAITNGLVDPSASTTEEMKQRAGSMHGISMAKWRQQHPQAASGAGGHVTVQLSQEAKKLLQILPATNNMAAATGSPPTNTYVQQASR